MLLSACSSPSSTDLRLSNATPTHYSRVALIYARRLRWLAGWLMAVESTIFCASLPACRGLPHNCITARGPSLGPGLRRRACTGAVSTVYAGLSLPVTMLLGSSSWPGSHKPIPLRTQVDRPSRIQVAAVIRMRATLCAAGCLLA